MRGDAVRYARMPFAVLAYLRAPRLAEPVGEIRAQWEQREARFLDTLRRTVFADPAHPYHRMFQLAGCAFGDLAGAVKRDGLEPTLEALRRAGVFLTHDEFKGRAPIIRSGEHLPAGGATFNNSLVRGGLVGSSSGSRGTPVPTLQSVAFMRHYEAQLALLWSEFDLGGRAHADLRSILPSLRSIETCLAASRLGHRIDRQRSRGLSCAITSMVSSGVRVAAAALDHGLDIHGTIFLGGGEAVTPAKRAVVESAGADIYPRYHITEIGNIGHACRQMRGRNSVHVYTDSVAVIGQRRPAPLSGVEVNSLLFTTLLPQAPRVLVNVEMEDSGLIAAGQCGCAFARAGLSTVIHDVASFGKLTGHGVTLVGTDIVAILEERLPAALGGRVGDFQLVERDVGRQTQIVLHVSPRVRASPATVHRCFLDELRREWGGAYAAGSWMHADAIRVVVAEPLAGRTGKFLPLHLLGSPAPRDSR